MLRFVGTVGASLALAFAAAAVPGAPARAIETGWRRLPLTGIPDTASVSSVAAGVDGFAAVGQDLADGDDRSGFVVWRSADGTAWSEVYRSPGDFAPEAQIVATGRGFAAIGSLCTYPQASESESDDPHCDPVSVASPDGTHWQRSQVGNANAAESADFRPASTYLHDLAEADDGSLLAVGWVEHRPKDADPAVWHSDDGGSSWVPVGTDTVPGMPGRRDGMTSLIRTDDQWLASGYEEIDRRSNASLAVGGRAPRVWRSRDGVRWERAEPPEQAESAQLLTKQGSVVFLSGGSPRGVSVWRADAARRWSSTDNGFPQGPPNSLSVLEAGRRGLLLAGLENQPDGQTRPVAWGSSDGISFERTLEAPPSTWFVAAVHSKDQWFLFGRIGSGKAATTGWVASDDCATGRTCGRTAPIPAVPKPIVRG